MSLNLNSESIQEHCRVCLQQGDVNMWIYKVSVENKQDIEQNLMYMEKSYLELVQIFYNSQDLLHLTQEFPLVCWQCMENLKFCYTFYEKLKFSNIQLENLYQESLNQYIDEEYLIEEVDEKELQETKEFNDPNTIEPLNEENVLGSNSNNNMDSEEIMPSLHKINYCKNIPLNKNDAFVITQFVPSTLDPTAANITNQTKDDEEESPTQQQRLTLKLKAVEVKDFENLEIPSPVNLDSTEPALYVCQYCPQAFAKFDYLRTHILKSHACKFCTQTFAITEQLFKHIREVHTEHKCAICHKLLSSQTNLRHHIKRVHRINLPAKVTLLDFIKSTNVEEIEEVITQQDADNATDKDFSIQ